MTGLGALRDFQRRATDLQLQYHFTYHLRSLLEYRREHEGDPQAVVLRDDFAPAAYLEAIADHNERPSRIGRRAAPLDSFALQVPVTWRIEVDGDLGEWDLSGSTLMCYDVKAD